MDESMADISNSNNTNVVGFDNAAYDSQHENRHLKLNGETNGEAHGEKGTNKVSASDASLNGDPNKKEDKKNSDEKSDEDKKKKEEPVVSYSQLFRYARVPDKLLMIMGSLGAICHGAGMPAMMIVFGDMTDAFLNNANSLSYLDGVDFSAYGTTRESALADPSKLESIVIAENLTEEFQKSQEVIYADLVDEIQKFALYFFILGLLIMVAANMQITLWLLASNRQTKMMRNQLYKSILRQDIGWFDTHEAGELNSRLSDDVNKVQEGIGDKIGNGIQWTSTSLVGIIIGFVYGWKLSLVIFAFGPLLAISGAIMTKLAGAYTTKELGAYAKAGAVADEVIGAIRTVAAFGGEEKEIKRYSSKLSEAEAFGIRKGILNGGAMGLMMFIIFGVYAMAFWYGSKLVREDDYTPGQMLIVYFCVLIGAFALGNAGPHFQAVTTARGAAHVIYELMDREPVIDNATEEGLKPSSITGSIEFKDVHFNYPSRKEIKILDGMNLQIDNGLTVALVGSSGCGKSTTIQLLQRFYDVDDGEILVDGNNIKDLNLKWLRSNIGVVSQEPVLFGTTIEENIRYGHDDVTMEDIEKAAKEANAHDFISRLPHGYETLVGERGAQMSGGQKQRIAIARALVRNPRILLLDEATSALDMESESIVQAALDKARQGRTTILIAHRLSTVRTADRIMSIDQGKVVQSGTHDELMEVDGIYKTLVTNQSQGFDEDMDEVTDTADVEITRDAANRSSIKKGGLTRVLSMSKGKEKEEDKLAEVGMGRVMKLNASEWPWILIACIAAAINGTIMPAFGIIFAEILTVFTLPKEEQADEALLWSMMFLVIGVIQGICMLVMGYGFSKSGEALTKRVRVMVFSKYMRQDIGFFDDPKNSTGALTTRLSTDGTAVQGATGARLGTLLQNLIGVGAGVIIGFIFSWKLTLLIIGFVPFILIGSFLQIKLMVGYAAEGNNALEGAGKVASESINNIRTVATLGREQTFITLYSNHLEGPYRDARRKAILNGFVFGITQALLFWADSAIFYLGAYLIENDGLTFENLFKVFGAVVFSAMGAGQASQFAPDYGKSKLAANRIFALLDRESPIDSSSEEGNKLSALKGVIEFQNVKFSYPSRPTVPVLRGLDLVVNPGQTVALVGSSGCGKSTTIQLLERFYDPLGGMISVDGNSLPSLNLKWWREQMGFVQQEPILFDCSIAENIAYGDNTREVPMGEIVEAARNANIHQFVESLPDGYDTNVGDKGTQLSGGQKQRIAIARALVRNPKVLLLDEATSALDTESEKIVQDALDKAQQGRTSIVIAHRLSTIQDADVILVFNHGKISEMGTHSNLMADKGIYYRLQMVQQRF